MKPKLLTPWRLFLDGPRTGARNMAVDEAMLLAHARGLVPPTLRFYGWNPGCLSLGRLQKQWPEGNASGYGDFDMVRRPTGGRGVWHAQEITYCAVVRAELLPPAARSVAGAYNWLSAGFLRGLQSLGVPVELAACGVRTNGANCFAASAGCDFVVEGKKLIGAAQCRKDGAILQHGSILLSIEEEKWRQIAGGPMDGATSLQALGADFKPETVVEALCGAFALEVGALWQPDGLSEREELLAQLLLSKKYGTAEWTLEAQLAAETPTLIDQIIGKWESN